jgi:REP element-mobilizing transposase RayT
MARPLRIEFPGALYHVTTRGDHRALIYVDDADRHEWLSILADVCLRFNFIAFAYCQMGNHYHLMLETPDGNLSQGMRRLNSVYSQYFNRRHQQIGHVLQGRYKAILVQRESYLLELARYIVLNPVRSNLVISPGDWIWSSYRATVGAVRAPGWLDVDSLLRRFGDARDTACTAYKLFIDAGAGADSPLIKTRHQLVLGDEAFIAQYSQPLEIKQLTAVCRSQRRMAAHKLAHYAAQFPDRDQAMAEAYFSTAYSMNEIGEHFGVSCQTVGRAVRRHTVK